MVNTSRLVQILKLQETNFSKNNGSGWENQMKQAAASCLSGQTGSVPTESILRTNYFFILSKSVKVWLRFTSLRSNRMWCQQRAGQRKREMLSWFKRFPCFNSNSVTSCWTQFDLRPSVASGHRLVRDIASFQTYDFFLQVVERHNQPVILQVNLKKSQSSSLATSLTAEKKGFRTSRLSWRRQEEAEELTFMIYQTEEEEEEEVQKGKKRHYWGKRERSLLILLSMKKSVWARIRLLQFSVGWPHLLARWDITFCYLFSSNSRRKLWSWCILVDNLRERQSGGEREVRQMNDRDSSSIPPATKLQKLLLNTQN